MDDRPRNRFCPPIGAPIPGVPGGGQLPDIVQGVPHYEVVKPTFKLSRQQWRQVHRARCYDLWEDIPVYYLTKNLDAQRDHLILLRATLDWLDDTYFAFNMQRPPIPPPCHKGMLTGKESKSADKGMREERIAFWALIYALPPEAGNERLGEMGGDPQQRALYLAHRYIRGIWGRPL